MLEKIKSLLGEELANQVTEKLGAVELGITNDGSLVPADKHDSMKAELKTTQERLEGLQGQLKEMETSTGTIEELKAQLKVKGEEFETFKTEVAAKETNRVKINGLTKGLKEAGAIEGAIDLLIGTFDLEKVVVDKAGNVVDVNDIINPIKESRASLFTTAEPNNNPPPNNHGGGGEDDDDAQSFFDKAMKKKE